MSSKTYLPGDLVMIKQDSWFTNVKTWTLALTKKSLRGIFLGSLTEENKSFHDFLNPCRVMINGDEEIIVEISKINYFKKRRNYEKVN